MNKAYELLTFSVAPNLVRHDRLDEREYLVVPMVMMVEGVHNGSGGPLYYPEEELSLLPQVWNSKPVVVYHPEQNGQSVSACSPEILNSYGVGVIMNTKWDAKGKRLLAEAWLEKTKTEKVDNRILEAVEKGEMMEVSTGLFMELEQAEGEWNGEAYTGIARNHRPDHLAILPDKVGACSIADGAGLLRNQLKNTKGDKEQDTILNQLLNKLASIKNEASHSNIRHQISTQLSEYLNLADDGKYDVWVEDVYSNFFVYEHGNSFYRLSYKMDGENLTLEGTPQEVVRVTEYRTKEGSFVGNEQESHETQKTNTDMDKNKIVNELISGPVFNEDQKDWLLEQDVEILNGLKGQSDVVANSLKEAAEAQETTPPATNVDEYIKQGSDFPYYR